MFARLRQRQPGARLGGLLFRATVRNIFAVWLTLCFRLRCEGRENIPSSGAVIFAANHQSYLDPIIIGVGSWKTRQFISMARSSLFINPVFGRVITWLSAFAVERGTSDMKAMRHAIDVLKQDHAMLIFPEGTRTDDGKVAPFKSGLTLLVKRSGAMVIPTAVEGAFDAWPRGGKLKPRGRVSIRFGEPIPGAKLLDEDPDLAALSAKVESMRLELKQAQTDAG